jgi:hypothetical protein
MALQPVEVRSIWHTRYIDRTGNENLSLMG